MLIAEPPVGVAVPDLFDRLLEQVSEARFVDTAGAHFTRRGHPDRRPGLVARPPDVRSFRALDVVRRTGPAEESALEPDSSLSGAVLRVLEVPVDRLGPEYPEVLAGVMLLEIVLDLRVEGLHVNSSRSDLRREVDEHRKLMEVGRHADEREVHPRHAVDSRRS